MEWDNEARFLHASQEDQDFLLIAPTMPETDVESLLRAAEASLIELAEEQTDLSRGFEELPDAQDLRRILLVQHQRLIAERLVRELSGFSWDIALRYIEA